jgi:hypothetical protein
MSVDAETAAQPRESLSTVSSRFTVAEAAETLLGAMKDPRR